MATPASDAAASAPSSIDEYLAGFPDDVRPLLEQVRATIAAAIPQAEETIKYGMPTFLLGGRYALYFAGWKKHVGVYPVARGDEEFERMVAPYRAAKDSLNFVYTKPIPHELIATVARAAAVRAEARSSPPQ